MLSYFSQGVYFCSCHASTSFLRGGRRTFNVEAAEGVQNLQLTFLDHSTQLKFLCNTASTGRITKAVWDIKTTTGSKDIKLVRVLDIYKLLRIRSGYESSYHDEGTHRRWV